MGPGSGRNGTEIAPRVVVDLAVRSGKPVIQGTRVPVELVIARLAGGTTADEVAEDYGIALEDVRAALSYAARAVAAEEVRARRRIDGSRLQISPEFG
ncbi:MAG: DUF433 domain-containing protein [Chloroflexi bacterium]|nr:DUF433 domain-containing protein [Chloroflexota bacterium]